MANADTDRDERQRLRRRIGRLRGQIDRRGALMIGQIRPLMWLWDRWFSRPRRHKETSSHEEK